MAKCPPPLIIKSIVIIPRSSILNGRKVAAPHSALVAFASYNVHHGADDKNAY